MLITAVEWHNIEDGNPPPSSETGQWIFLTRIVSNTFGTFYRITRRTYNKWEFLNDCKITHWAYLPFLSEEDRYKMSVPTDEEKSAARALDSGIE